MWTVGLDALAVFLHLLACYFFFFFFSSRRRHTRSTRDWSSDVCSSDLDSRPRSSTFLVGADQLGVSDDVRLHRRLELSRSEERRVGKECRSRWWPDH